MEEEIDKTRAGSHQIRSFAVAGRVGKPEGIAEMAAFLISPEALFIIGSNFVGDRGMTRN